LFQPDLAVLPTVNVRQHRLQNVVEHPHLLVVEILSPLTAADRRARMAFYARIGIPEYWIVDLVRSRMGACTRTGPAYNLIEQDDRGRVRFSIFPGLVMEDDSLSS
jgi:Uma2 family endonuclease